MSIRNKNVGSKFGFLSIILSAVPLAALLAPGFPQGNVIVGYLVIGAWGASALFAVVAGVIGSRCPSVVSEARAGKAGARARVCSRAFDTAT